jgi:hypothetical protein
MSDQIFESSTPGIETITIAASGEYQIIADGAEGGSETGNGNPGGAGAAVIGDIYLQAGTKLEIVIGGEGGNGDGMVGAGVGAGGGGGSFVFEPSGTGGIGTLLAVAGGGGGAGSDGAGGGGQAGPKGANGGYGGYGGANGAPGGGGGYGGGGGGYTGGAASSNGGSAGESNGTSFAGGLGAPVSTFGTPGVGGFGGGGGGGSVGGGGGGGYGGGGGGGNGGSSGGGGGGSYDSDLSNANATADSNAGNGSVTIDLLCFLRGTRILTPTGEVCVEDLRIGDAVVTRFGGFQRIKWIGRQNFEAAALGEGRDHLPVRLRAGSLGEGLPARDLFISPGHSMLVGDTLVLARSLVNGITITQDEAPARIEYFQIDLGRHDCVIAEGTWSETFADGPGLRKDFHNAAEYEALYPDEPPPEALNLCAKRPERGAALDAVLRPIVARASDGLAPGKLRGNVDAVRDEWKVDGWAQDSSHPELPVLLEVLLEGRVIGTVLACDFRNDLLQAGIGQGRCSFVFNSPVRLRPDLWPTLWVRRLGDGAPLAVSKSIRGDAKPVLRVVA